MTNTIGSKFWEIKNHLSIKSTYNSKPKKFNKNVKNYQYTIYTKFKFGLDLERDKIVSFKKMESDWTKVTNKETKLNKN